MNKRLRFLLAAAAVLIVVFVRSGRINRPGPGYPIYVRLQDACGIGVGAPVRMAGIEIGHVVGLALTPELQAQITLRIRPGVTIPTGSRFSIRTQGLPGDAFITIMPGPVGEPALPAGSTVAGSLQGDCRHK